MSFRVIVRLKDTKSGIARIALGRELKDACHTIAEQGLAHARATSPSGFGGYAQKFEILDEVLPDFPGRQGGDPPMPRVAATLINQSELAVLVEVGHGGEPRQQEYRVLTNTLHWLAI